MIVRPLSPGMRGIDTVATLSAEECLALKQGGYEFVIRYLDSLTDAELSAILNAGLGFVGCRYSRQPGWEPTGAMGTSDGIFTVARAKERALPPGMAIACDLEGPNPATTTRDATAYLNAWSEKVVQGGYVAMLYVGYGCVLTGAELGSLPYFTHYWRSCSITPEVSHGFCMMQLRPPDLHVMGIQVDIDVVEEDWHTPGRTPPALWAA